MRKAYRYRLYPTGKQAAFLDGQVAEACRLYNAALQERRDAYRIAGRSLNYYEQANQLKEIRAAGDLALENFSCSQDVLRRVDKTFKTFFARVKKGGTAGFPRFKPRSRFDSITFPSYGDGCRLLPYGKLKIQGAGHIKVKLHRPIVGTIKTVTIKREAGKWYVCFSVEYEPAPLPHSAEAVGLDVGLSAFVTLSDSTEVENPRHYREAQARLRRAQRKVARRKRGSNRRRKAVVLLQKAHAHVRNQRTNFHHQLSRTLVNQYGVIVVENLNVKGLSGGMLAKSVHDAGWSAFLTKLAYKAAEAGRVFVKVDPRGTSQTCLCGARVPKTLKVRWHECEACGLSAPRDHISAQLILRLGLSLLGLTWPTAASVPNEAVCFS
ncbi:MAG TPA: transposase [Blastocatellia bacterium]|nr:transposase [Blastocatellia bacterium]